MVNIESGRVLVLNELAKTGKDESSKENEKPQINKKSEEDAELRERKLRLVELIREADN